MLNPVALGDVGPALMALAGCLVFEALTLSIAYRHISSQADLAGLGFFQYLKKGADPASVQVFMEDSAALAGVAIATSALMLSKYLSLPWIDPLGSISIGILLSSVAVFLVKRNIGGLIQKRMDPDREQEIVAILENDPIVM